MLIGAHVLIYSKNPEADRAFFRDVLGFLSVDAGQGWLIFKLPPAEAAFHPADSAEPRVTLYLMCDDLSAQIKHLESRKVRCAKIDEAPWGSKTSFRLPGGGEVGLYQPRHLTALHLGG